MIFGAIRKETVKAVEKISVVSHSYSEAELHSFSYVDEPAKFLHCLKFPGVHQFSLVRFFCSKRNERKVLYAKKANIKKLTF